MALDMRRELSRIHTEFDRQAAVIGESVLWFPFDADNTQYLDVYDEFAERAFQTPRYVTVLWVDQIEDPEQYSDSGRRPTQRLRFAVSTRMLDEADITTTEAHGGRVWDPIPAAQEGRPASQIRRDRLNDVVYYDGRFYGISNYQIRGRAKTADALIGVTAIEMQADERLTSLLPGFGSTT